MEDRNWKTSEEETQTTSIKTEMLLLVLHGEILCKMGGALLTLHRCIHGIKAPGRSHKVHISNPSLILSGTSLDTKAWLLARKQVDMKNVAPLFTWEGIFCCSFVLKTSK